MMGTFHYGTAEVSMDDEDLALFETVAQLMAEKSLPFFASFQDAGSGRLQSFWMSSGDHSRYDYDAATSPGEVDSWHLDLMLACADSDDGIMMRSS